MSSAFWRYNQDKVTKTMLNNKTFKPRGLGILNRTLYKKEEGQFSLGFGKAWSIQGLRLKSDMDLKLLWYVLLKEKLFFQSEVYMGAQRDQYSKKVTKGLGHLVVSMNRIKGVMNERTTHKNSMMKLLEFYDYKRHQYIEGFMKNFPEMAHIKNPMFSSSEIKKLDYLEKFIDEFKKIKRTDEIFERYNDHDVLYDKLSKWFNPLDPMELLNEFESADIVTKLNELNLAKKNFIYVMSDVKKEQKFSESILTKIRAKTNLNKENSENIEKNDNTVLAKENNSENSSNLNQNTKLTDSSDTENSMNNQAENKLETKNVDEKESDKSLVSAKPLEDEGYELELLEHEFKALIESPEYIRLQKTIEYFTNADVRVFKREVKPIHPYIKVQEKNYEAEIIKLLVEDHLPQKALKAFYSKAQEYLNTVRKNVDQRYTKTKEKYIKINTKNLSAEESKKTIDFLTEKFDRNLELANHEINKEFEYIEILNSKVHDFIGTTIKSRIIDEGIKKIMIFDYESIKSQYGDLNSSNSEKSNLENSETQNTNDKGNTEDTSSSKVSILTEAEKRAAESLKKKIRMTDLLPMYVENADHFRAKHKKHLISEIQRGRSKVASIIATKELGAISYQAKQLEKDFNSGKKAALDKKDIKEININEEKSLVQDLEAKIESVTKMKEEALKRKNESLGKVFESKETWAKRVTEYSINQIKSKDDQEKKVSDSTDKKKDKVEIIDPDTLIKNTYIYSKMSNYEENKFKQIYATLKSNTEIAKKNVVKAKGKKQNAGNK